MAVCPACHHWIETHANQCRAVGVIDTERRPQIGSAWLQEREQQMQAGIIGTKNG
jgi:hypothetical protein